MSIFLLLFFLSLNVLSTLLSFLSSFVSFFHPCPFVSLSVFHYSLVISLPFFFFSSLHLFSSFLSLLPYSTPIALSFILSFLSFVSSFSFFYVLFPSFCHYISLLCLLVSSRFIYIPICVRLYALYLTASFFLSLLLSRSSQMQLLPGRSSGLFSSPSFLSCLSLSGTSLPFFFSFNFSPLQLLPRHSYFLFLSLISLPCSYPNTASFYSLSFTFLSLAPCRESERTTIPLRVRCTPSLAYKWSMP